MNVISSMDEIKENINELERGRGANGTRLQEYQALIKRGTCFFPYESDSGLSFAPSRFIGYAGNKLKTHENNLNRDGRVTNVAINKILGTKPISNVTLERMYFEFCKLVGVVSSKSGAFGVERKYWITNDVSELLSDFAEDDIKGNQSLTQTERQQLVKARIGQGIFRESLVNMWGKCSVTSCSYVDILRASHIKPWINSTNEERLDKFNGLLLAPNFDALFDKGLISFDDAGRIMISKRLTAAERKSLGCFESAQVDLRPSHSKYMIWHRINVFKDAVTN